MLPPMRAAAHLFVIGAALVTTAARPAAASMSIPEAADHGRAGAPLTRVADPYPMSRALLETSRPAAHRSRSAGRRRPVPRPAPQPRAPRPAPRPRPVSVAVSGPTGWQALDAAISRIKSYRP